MRKVLLISLLALGVAGCANTGAPPQVRDLSVSRDQQPSDTVTVKAGDTLYGIAWRQSMDFRQLARMNNLQPPYRLQPGQTLRLNPGATAAPAAASDGAQVASANVSGVTTVENPDWLAPDAEAIQRNQGVSARPMGASTPSSEALASAGKAGGSNAPGPIYNYASPGADGNLSERDQAEQAALARQRAASQSAEATDASLAGAAPDVASSGTGQPSDTGSSSSAGNTATNGGAQVDAGTAVAGESAPSKSQQRTFKPVQDIPWQWPTEGQLVGRFGDGGTITAGIDIAGQKGQPVRAAGPGIVVYAGNGVRGYGNLILLKHNDRFLSAYAHNDNLKVEENDVVEAGEVIATMGNTDASGVKLHFEVRKDGQPKDPLEFLPPR